MEEKTTCGLLRLVGLLASVGYSGSSAARLAWARLRPRLLVLAFPRKHRLRESDDLKRRGFVVVKPEAPAALRGEKAGI